MTDLDRVKTILCTSGAGPLGGEVISVMERALGMYRDETQRVKISQLSATPDDLDEWGRPRNANL
jgi:hypothetical protein